MRVAVVPREVVSDVSASLVKKTRPALVVIRLRPPHSTEASSSHSQKVSPLLTFSGSQSFRQSRARAGSCSPGNFTKTLTGHLELERLAAVLVGDGVVGGVVRISCGGGLDLGVVEVDVIFLVVVVVGWGLMMIVL